MNAPHQTPALLDMHTAALESCDTLVKQIAALARDGAPASAGDVQTLHAACKAYQARRYAVREATAHEQRGHVEAWRKHWNWVYLSAADMTDVEPKRLQVYQHIASIGYRRQQKELAKHVQALQVEMRKTCHRRPHEVDRLLLGVSCAVDGLASAAAHNCALQEAELSYLRHIVWGTDIDESPYTLAPLDGE